MIVKKQPTQVLLMPAFALAVVFSLLLPGALFADAGRKVFMDHNCHRCHSVKAEGIDMVAGDVDDDEDTDGGDLSDIGNQYDRRFLAMYLIKRESIDGKEHQRRFRGEREELAAIANWLESLKHGPQD
jgi:mono/diheme cytochrome c family protein